MSEDKYMDSILKEYVELKTFPDGRICGIHRLLFHWTLHVDIHEYGYEDRYCYETRELASEALKEWDGVADPKNWHRHPKTGRRRDLIKGTEWIAW